MSDIGILAYGSLIREPGAEIEPLIARRIPTKTPFPVEYARLSQSRGGGPTVVPHQIGRPVSADILVLNERVSLDQAMDLLWRREVRKEGTGRRYVPDNTLNSVLVKVGRNYEGVAHPVHRFSRNGQGAHTDCAVAGRGCGCERWKSSCRQGPPHLLSLH